MATPTPTPYSTGSDFLAVVKAYGLWTVDEDLEGQVIIYTGLHLTKEGLIPFDTDPDRT